MSKNIYVGNISYNIMERDLEDLFSQYGEVTSVKIIIDRMTNRSKGFGFVEMQDDDAATAAISALNGTELSNRELRVNEARERTERNDRNDRQGFNNFR
ncbi:MAG: RNA-binding protein [Spirochaetales bacterium]|nr:RNA-binding protein [Spirochaetales bacterium]